LSVEQERFVLPCAMGVTDKPIVRSNDKSGNATTPVKHRQHDFMVSVRFRLTLALQLESDPLVHAHPT